MQINVTDTSAKAAARYIRQKTGVDVPHSTILHGIAVAGGYASWQAMSAALRNDTMVPKLPETEASQPAQQDKSVYGMVYADLDRGAAWELFRWSCKTIWLSRNDPARHDEWKRMMADYQRPNSLPAFLKNVHAHQSLLLTWEYFEIATILCYFQSTFEGHQVALTTPIIVSENRVLKHLVEAGDVLRVSKVLAFMEDTFRCKAIPPLNLMLYGKPSDMPEHYRHIPMTLVHDSDGAEKVHCELPPCMDIPNVIGSLERLANANTSIRIRKTDQCSIIELDSAPLSERAIFYNDI